MTRINPIVQPSVEPIAPKRFPTEDPIPQQSAAPADTVQIRTNAAEAALSSLAVSAARKPEVVVTHERWENLPDAPGDASSAKELASQIRAMMLKRTHA